MQEGTLCSITGHGSVQISCLSSIINYYLCCKGWTKCSGSYTEHALANGENLLQLLNAIELAMLLNACHAFVAKIL